MFREVREINNSIGKAVKFPMDVKEEIEK